MELAQDKIELIERLVRADRKFSGNEDLLDDFTSEACKRSFLIVKSVNDISSLEAYLKKIIATSIIVVLKDLGRVRRTKDGFIPTQEIHVEMVSESSTPSNSPTEVGFDRYVNSKINYDLIDIDDTPEEIVIKKELLQTVVDAIALAHSSDVSKQYMQLYELRYVKGLKQVEIAKELNLSQSEVSKRLFELMDFVKKSFD